MTAICRVCGCTEDKACPGGCSWVEPDLCSECIGRKVFYIEIDGKKIKVIQDPDDHYGEHMRHIEFCGITVAEVGISETGYRSHFFTDEDLLEGETIEQFALRIALQVRDKRKTKKLRQGKKYEKDKSCFRGTDSAVDA